MEGVVRPSISGFILETGFYSLLICILPFCYSFLEYKLKGGGGEHVASEILRDRGSVYGHPLEIRNLTVVAEDSSSSSAFYVEPFNLSDDPTAYYLSLFGCITVCMVFGCRFVDGIFMFRPSKAGIAASCSVTALFWVVCASALMGKISEDAVHGEGTGASTGYLLVFVACIIIGTPLIRVCARAWTTDPAVKGSLIRCFALFFIDEMSVGIIFGSYKFIILALFVDSETSLPARLLLRSVAHLTAFTLAISYSGWMHHQVVEQLGVNQNRATILFVTFATFFPLMGRLMQSSAVDITEVLAFEAFSVVSELATLDGLLKGMTPVKWVRNVVRNTLVIETANQLPTRRDENRLAFCSDATIVLSVSEAASLVVSCVEVMLSRVNFGAPPGMPNKSSSLLMINLGVMLFGELVVTDGIAEWVARTFKSRYLIDPSLEWARMKARAQGFLLAIIICLTLWTTLSIPTYFRNTGCITAFVGAEESWSVTSCPPKPTNITQMLVVGESYMEEWLAAMKNGTVIN
jgi:hypothetical protein